MARDANEDAIMAYKAILAGIIDNRPSGTRQRLAVALGKHRSFVTQITSPGYATPLPARHLATIFQVCHVSKAEQDRFLEAYQLAHPGKLPDLGNAGGLRQLTVMVADFGDERKNRMLDEAIQDFIQKIVLITGEGD
ncbi:MULTISPECIES: hypothetical protein [unclassified Rhizobium]|uniref:hypothetical protein n=1 Tax=unclassified Rhizobium TaxID=2613769 RepID=UPI000715FAAF|nr:MULTISPECIES: hypothetical protein [unclassified Rhizobium]KQS89571.1 hypothetical protein ASG42_12785 [Rhizobium sp. Leaf391]KQS94850.1 hypothetical protein ASG50_26735 [Rhizobium sp. Leaf386]KQU01226.1 hypothetical protein ASG68_05515 [Rhizobium sp. Leaf453]